MPCALPGIRRGRTDEYSSMRKFLHDNGRRLNQKAQTFINFHRRWPVLSPTLLQSDQHRNKRRLQAITAFRLVLSVCCREFQPYAKDRARWQQGHTRAGGCCTSNSSDCHRESTVALTGSLARQLQATLISDFRAETLSAFRSTPSKRHRSTLAIARIQYGSILEIVSKW